MKSVSPPSLVLTLCLGAVAACASDGVPRDVPIVRDIDIRGENVLSESEIKERILTTEASWWPFSEVRPFNEADWQTDLRRIERYYESRGYYQARIVKTQIVPVPTKQGQQKKVDLVVELEENQPVLVGEVNLRGLEPVEVKAQEAMKTEWPLVKGDVFREDDWATGKNTLEKQLRELGHATAQVEGNASVDVGKYAANLQIDAIPGPRYFFGGLDVRTGPGLRVPRPWIEEQVRLAIAPEMPFSEAALEEAQRRVFAMNVFSTARVTTGQPDPASSRIPVVVEVREGPVHTLRLGGGVGIDQVRQEARLISEWTDRNFLGGLRRLALRGQAGWAFLPSTISVLRSTDNEGPRHGPIYRASADFDQPRLFGRPSLRGKALVESERTMEQTYDAIGGRGLAGVSWTPRSTLTIFPTYNLQGNFLNGSHRATDRSAPLALGCNTDPCFVLLSFLEQVVTSDTRDNALEPRRGHYFSLSLQEGGGLLGGDFDYLRVLPEARAYYTFGRDLFTVAGRLKVGTLLTRSRRPEESAVTTRFFSGGSQSMRGFGIRRLSPMLLVPIEGSEMDPQYLALPIGGNGLVEGSIEVRSRASENLMLAAFTDFGSVTRNRLPPIHKLPDFLWAVGFGFRYLTPVGPLRVDLAFRLPVGRPPPLYKEDGTEITYKKVVPFEENSETGANMAGGCFGIGSKANESWVRDGLCAFHVSIGEAF